MSFTAMPGWLFAGLAVLLAGILAVLHYLLIRPRRVKVITALFWEEATRQVRARSLFERFRHLLTYLFLLVTTLLILLALAKPVLDARSEPSRVIALSAGLEMTTDDARFERAVELLRSEVGASEEGKVAVLVADPQPRLIKHFDESREVLEGRLSKVGPSHLPCIQRDVVRAARSLLEGRGRGEIVFVAAQPATLDGPRVTVLAAGEPIDNAFILSVAFVPDASDPTRGELHWRVGFNGREEGRIEALTRKGGETLGESAIRLMPGTMQDVVVSGVPADGDMVTVSVSGSDAIKGDSRLDYRLPDQSPIRVVPAGDAAVPPVLMSLCNALPECATGTVARAGGAVVTIGPEGSGGRIIVRSSGAMGDALPVSATAHPLTAGLVFEDALCRAPSEPWPSRKEHVPLLLAGGVPVALLDREADALIVAESLLDETASVVGRAGYAVFWSRMLRHFAGWRDAPLAVSPYQPYNPEYGARDTLVMKASLENLAVPEGQAPPVRTSGGMRLPPWQIALGAALALLLLEAVLSVHGKIP